MSFKEDIWNEIGERRMIFTNLNSDTERLNLQEMREELINDFKDFKELSDDLEKKNRYGRFIGIINHAMNKEIENYFPAYKSCAFSVSYNVYRGEEMYFLNCHYDFNLYGISSDNLENEYEHFKAEIDRGVLG